MATGVSALFTCTVVSVEKHADGTQNVAKTFTGEHTPKYAVAPTAMQCHTRQTAACIERKIQFLLELASPSVQDVGVV